MESVREFNSDPRVAAVRLSAYEEPCEGDRSPSLLALSHQLDWFDYERGPFGKVISPGSRVLIKPNFVLHENEGKWDIEPLLTHPSLVKQAVFGALKAGAAEVVVGDAPIQSCDFARLLAATGLDRWSEELKEKTSRFKGILDFRRTTCRIVDGVRVAEEGLLPEDRFVRFDLGSESLLEPISSNGHTFRVTRYDPRLMAETHSPGRHRYLIAKEVMEADVVINLPKLKTHKKAGVTCALKNLIGINGNKEYLPHHRVGGSATGGDCYPGASPVKRALEYSLDRRNMARSHTGGKLWNEIAVNLDRLARRTGDQLGTEGSWSGNDTIWRTCLDLNRILLYGREDASLADQQQRRVIHIVDAITAGQGDGPLSPEPFPLGLIFAGQNAAAVDWIGATLLGYNPMKIPIVRGSFREFKWRLAQFGPDEVTLRGDLGSGPADYVLRDWAPSDQMKYPKGWVDAVR
ncbi:MAG: hypothetical protein DMF61_04025 [Blastocatellia bacterium AA13]|nr:MAG: hypothetical protein DMF61_04025 [Blastocatellia bacterium AA13]